MPTHRSHTLTSHKLTSQVGNSESRLVKVGDPDPGDVLLVVDQLYFQSSDHVGQIPTFRVFGRSQRQHEVDSALGKLGVADVIKRAIRREKAPRNQVVRRLRLRRRGPTTSARTADVVRVKGTVACRAEKILFTWCILVATRSPGRSTTMHPGSFVTLVCSLGREPVADRRIGTA